MNRSVKKGAYVANGLIRKIKKLKEANWPFTKQPFKVYSRRSDIISAFIGMKMLVHKGKGFTLITITQEMVGLKIGALVPTRAPVKHANPK